MTKKKKKTTYLHKAIYCDTVKIIYNITIKKNTQAAAQRYSKKTCKLTAFSSAVLQHY